MVKWWIPGGVAGLKKDAARGERISALFLDCEGELGTFVYHYWNNVLRVFLCLLIFHFLLFRK